jgi:hypothetical protein
MRHNLYQACRLLATSLICCLALSGCAVHQLHSDHDKIRTALLDLYTNQIIDNLIRAYNGLPIIQLDYTNAVATVTVVDTESLNDTLATSSTVVTTNSLSPSLTNGATSSATKTTSATPSTVAALTATLTSAAATALSVVTTHGLVNTVAGTSTHSNSNQVALTATPVTTSNDVYDAYLYFLSLQGSLQAGPCQPEPDQAVIWKKVGKVYYWVPAEFRKEFFALSLATTAQRGNPVPSTLSFERTLLTVSAPPETPDSYLGKNQDKVRSFDVVLDRSVPNAPGEMVIDGKTLSFTYYTPAQGPRPATTKTIRLYVNFTPQLDPAKSDGSKTLQTPFGATDEEQFISAIRTKTPKVSLFIKGHQPEPPTTNDLLNRANFNLQQIQLNQLRGTGP